MRKAGLRMPVLLALLLLVLPALAGVRQLEVYVRDGCPHCAAAEQWLASQPLPDLQVRYLRVNADPAARERLLALSQAAGYWPPGVPTFVLDGQILLVGFDDGARSGAHLLAQLGSSSAAGSATPAPLPAGLSVEQLGLPLFTLAIGLLDGFNPCAMWVLLFLLSLLVHLRDRRRMALIAGTFVLVSGALYYAFLAAWLNLFLLVGLSGALLAALGALAVLIGAINLRDGLRRTGEFSLSIPAARKPGLYARMRAILQARSLLPALAGVATLAVVVNFIELLCTAGLPALYTAVLARQELPLLAYHGYLALYILGYIADDSLMVASAVLALGSRRLSPAGGRLLKLLSGALMLALGLVMLLQPQWLLPG